MADSKAKKEVKKDNKPGFFKTVSAEFKKIIWPTKESAFRQSVAVTIIAVVLGCLISLLDKLIQYGISFINTIG